MKLTLRLLQWLLYLPVHLLIVLARYPLAPMAVVFFTTNDKRQLLWPFAWLGTIDNDLGGDSGWRNEHIKPGSNPLSTWNRICWLWRNGGNAVNYYVLGCRCNSIFELFNLAMQDQRWFWCRPDGYWMVRAYIPWGKKYLNLFWGWSLFGEIDGRCKFTFTTRIKDSLPG